MEMRNCTSAVWLFCRICQTFFLSFFLVFEFFFSISQAGSDVPQPAERQPLRFDLSSLFYPTTRAERQASLRDTQYYLSY